MISLSVFDVVAEAREDACLLRASGELDASTAYRLRGPLDAARVAKVTTLVDLSEVTFIDTAGLRVLLDAANAANEHRWGWFIVRPSPTVLRVIELTGTARQLPLVSPSDSAFPRGAIARTR